MKRTRIWLLLLAAAILFAAPVSANSIPISNAGFEAAALTGPGGFVSYIPGWTMPSWIPDTSGTFRPGTAQYPGGIPEGLNVAFTKGPWISQTLTTTLQSGMIYALMVDVGLRLDNSSGPWTGFTISLLAGNTVIASSSAGAPKPGQWITALASFTALAGNPLIGQPLTILLSVNQPYPYQVNFDNVRLNANAIPSSQTPTSAVPEPSTFALLGTGLLGLIRRRAARR